MTNDFLVRIGIDNSIKTLSQNLLIKLHELFLFIAERFFNYPDNPGMPVIPQFNYYLSDYLETVELREKLATTAPRIPKNIWEILFITFPKMNLNLKVNFEDSIDGFYNFYVINYANNRFLPDPISEFLQIYFGLCDNISILEEIREFLFISLIIYFEIINIRYALYWFLTINPFVQPLSYITVLTDWMEDILDQIAPSIGGSSTHGVILGTLQGLLLDLLNNTIFTMPYLPSEGKASEIMIEGSMTKVIMFSGLPELWRKYPIPNDLREYWYSQKPEVIEFMEKRYADEGINFLPDKVLEKMHLNMDVLTSNNLDNPILSSINVIKNVETAHFPTEIINLINIPESFFNFLIHLLYIKSI